VDELRVVGVGVVVDVGIHAAQAEGALSKSKGRTMKLIRPVPRWIMA